MSRMLTANPASEGMICLNVFFHIVRNNDGSGGINDYEVNAIISNLNGAYNPYNIKFNNLGTDHIYSTFYSYMYPSQIGGLIAINNKSNAINFYIVDTAVFNGYGDILGNNVILTKDAAITLIAAHEVGHNLNLYHTHETKFGVEVQIDCSSPDTALRNCTFAGDLICDTPPDPGLRTSDPNNPYKVDSYCNYTENDGYHPDTRNIMSYTSPDCLLHFTEQQAIRMRDAILNSPVLQPLVNCSCSDPTIFGKSNIGSMETVTYTVPCGTVSAFSTTTNLLVINSTNTSITVKPVNSNVNGEAYVRAVINGVLYQKDIWVGNPKIDIVLNADGNYVYLTLVGSGSDINKQEITHIEWETLSSTGNAVMGIAVNQFENLAHGIGTNWIINARIKAENKNGITYIYRDITPPVPLPCEDYYMISKTNKNEFSVYLIIDPCATSLATNSVKKEKVKDSDIKKASLFNVYGNQIKEYKANNFNTWGLKKGVYIFKVRIKNEIVLKKIIIE
ncbi:MAG: zinc-dependent metalloprotease [Bacteroidales bacterium]|nr:zinc-dependent metalloprotease [Bacteroidales bacterium]